MPESTIILKGEARIRLIEQDVLSHARKINPSMTREELEHLYENACVIDTGWSTNTITDLARRTIAAGTAFGSSLNIFIHESTIPSNALVNTLQFLYTSQTPTNQVRAPDSFVADASALVQTRTVEYPAPNVARNINTVGLTFSGAVGTSTSTNYLTGIAAFTVLSSTIVQSTSQVADVQYRVTFSIES